VACCGLVCWVGWVGGRAVGWLGECMCAWREENAMGAMLDESDLTGAMLDESERPLLPSVFVR